jgi:(R,R)-butanediol dehydrogenase / meso-butanediol dehydrogenase / diacetyl reductase
VTAVYYEGAGRFSVGASEVQPPGPGEVRLDVAFSGVCGTDIHIAHGHMDHRVQAPQVIGHEMSGTVAELGPGVEGYAVGDLVVVRPLDTRGETPADKGVSHICRDLRFLGIDTPGSFQSSWTVPAFTLHRLPSTVDLRLAALVEPLAVACHDTRLGAVGHGETAVVIGGGPIGLLVGLVARERGAAVVLSEVSPFRRSLAADLGLDVIDPSATDLPADVLTRTDGAGADVVFEVSGSAAGADMMTQLACIRGRIVVVAIFPAPQPVRLFDFFWKELRLTGARVYEPEDYEQAIDFVASGTLPLERLITSVEPLDRLPSVFENLDGEAEAMKILIDCRA